MGINTLLEISLAHKKDGIECKMLPLGSLAGSQVLYVTSWDQDRKRSRVDVLSKLLSYLYLAVWSES